MKTITKSYNVYKFSELSDEAKQKAIDNWYKKEDYPFLSCDIMDHLGSIDIYFKDVKIYYSLSYCQGDGLCFEGNLDLVKFMNDKWYMLKRSQREVIINSIYKVFSKGNTGHYCYSSKNDIEYELNDYNFENKKHLFELWERIFSDIQSYYLVLCKKLEKFGYDTIEYRMDFKEFEEHSEANLYEYLENGEIA